MEIIRHFDYTGKGLQFLHVCYRNVETDGFAQHVHSTFELIYLKRGEVTYTVEGKSYRIESGTCILTRPGTQHAVILNRKDIYERYVVFFETSMLSPQVYSALPQNLDVIRLNGYPIAEQLFQRLDFYAEHLDQETLGLMLQRGLDEILLNLSIISSRYSDLVDSHRYTANTIVTQAIDYISQNLSSDIRIDSICRQLHITNSYLHQLFMEHLQISPKKYINMKRLMKARLAIRAGSKPTAVYADCGFQDYCSFYRNYRKFFGYPPSEESEKIR